MDLSIFINYNFNMRIKNIFYLIISIAITACQSATPAATNTPSIPTATVTPQATLTPTATPLPTISRVIILTIDGLRPDAIRIAGMPNLLNLIQNGAYSLTAQTIDPSSTLPAHASMLTGQCPAKHGVDWNDYEPEQGFAQGIDLFDITHQANMKTYIFAGKEKMQQLTEPASLDQFVYNGQGDTALMEQLMMEFPRDFGFLFIHFPTTDRMGHDYGWLSPEQIQSIQNADTAIGQLMDTLEAYNLFKDTLIIITSDHGGHEDTHGYNIPEDMTIPWIIVGPGIKRAQLTTPINIMDTAATAAFALGHPIPMEWDGTPIYEAFGMPPSDLPTQPCTE